MFLNIIVIVFGVLLIVVLFFLFVPFLIEIDSNINLFRISIIPVFKIHWVMEDFPGHLEMRILGIRKKMALANIISRKKLPGKNRSKSISPKKKINFYRITNVIRSFRIREMHVNIDTGNMPLNGQLYPVMFFLGCRTKQFFNINFTGRNDVVVTIENNAFRMLKAYMNNH